MPVVGPCRKRTSAKGDTRFGAHAGLSVRRSSASVRPAPEIPTGRAASRNVAVCYTLYMTCFRPPDARCSVRPVRTTLLKAPAMYEYLPEYLLEEPDRMVGLGRGLARTGSFILLIGVIAHAATAATSIVNGIGKQVVEPQSLAMLYPSLPTWWIPESIIGSLPALLLLSAGITLAAMGKKLKRIYF